MALPTEALIQVQHVPKASTSLTGHFLSLTQTGALESTLSELDFLFIFSFI